MRSAPLLQPVLLKRRRRRSYMIHRSSRRQGLTLRRQRRRCRAHYITRCIVLVCRVLHEGSLWVRLRSLVLITHVERLGNELVASLVDAAAPICLVKTS